MKFELKGSFTLAFLFMCLIQFCKSPEGKDVKENNQINIAFPPIIWFMNICQILDETSIKNNDYLGMYMYINTELNDEIEITRNHEQIDIIDYK